MIGLGIWKLHGVDVVIAMEGRSIEVGRNLDPQLIGIEKKLVGISHERCVGWCGD